MPDTNDFNTNDNLITYLTDGLDELDDDTDNVQLHNFFRNITNTIYNNSFLNNDSNTIYDEIVAPAATPVVSATTPIQSFIFNQPRSGSVDGNNMGVQSNITSSTRSFLTTPMRFHNIYPDSRNRYTTSDDSGTNGIANSNVLTSVIQSSFETDKDQFKHIISHEGKKLLKGV